MQEVTCAQTGRGGCVAAGHPLTAEAAITVLREGGNAFDAVIAALWTACLTEPVLASLGGGGFLLARPRTGEAVVHDFFVHTPCVRRPEAELCFYPIDVDFGVATQRFHIGPGAAAVPGFTRGLFSIHRAHASMPMADLVAPALELTRDGVLMTAYQAYLLSVVGAIYRETPAARALFTSSGEAANPVMLAAGDRMQNPDLRSTLAALAHEGERLFYEGDLANTITTQCREHGGYLTREDLSRYRVHQRKPLTFRYRDCDLLLNPPPASGGMLIAFGLGLLGHTDLKACTFGSQAHAKRVASVMAATNHARLEACTKGQFTPDVSELLSPELLARYAKEVAPQPKSHRGTTHISVIDRKGNAASTTVSNGEGCGYIVPGAGFMLNNMLGEEDVNPAGFHRFTPGTRMSSMMSPSIAQRRDGSTFVTGSGGSNRIRTAVLQVLINLIDFGFDPQTAVEAARLHLEKNHLNYERTFPQATREALAQAYPEHTDWPEPNMFFGGAHTVCQQPDGTLVGAGDSRRAGVCRTC